MRKLFELDQYNRAPETLGGQLPVAYEDVDVGLPRRFSVALRQAEAQKTERPMQRFFEKHPAALVMSVIGVRKAWLFPRIALQKALGGGFEADFLICDWASLGPEWTLVELESPTKRPVNTRGISGSCRHAQQQISDYRRMLEEHTEGYQLEGLPWGHRHKRSWLVIGRRIEYPQENRARLADLRKENVEVASYDRLLEHLKQQIEWAKSTGRVRGVRNADRR